MALRQMRGQPPDLMGAQSGRSRRWPICPGWSTSHASRRPYPPRQPGSRRVGPAGRHRPDGVPHRAGGADQRPQARAGTTGASGRRAAAPVPGSCIDIRNPLAGGQVVDTPVPGSGTGLIGLSERVHLAGGEAGSRSNGDR